MSWTLLITAKKESPALEPKYATSIISMSFQRPSPFIRKIDVQFTYKANPAGT